MKLKSHKIPEHPRKPFNRKQMFRLLKKTELEIMLEEELTKRNKERERGSMYECEGPANLTSAKISSKGVPQFPNQGRFSFSIFLFSFVLYFFLFSNVIAVTPIFKPKTDESRIYREKKDKGSRYFKSKNSTRESERDRKGKFFLFLENLVFYSIGSR